MVMFVYLVVALIMKEQLKFATTIFGELFLIRAGLVLMLELYAISLDILQEVCDSALLITYHTLCDILLMLSNFCSFTVATPLAGSYYGKPNKTVHFRDVSCSGNELNLAECSKTVLSLYYGKQALPNTEVAGVDCVYDVPTPPPCVPKPVLSPGSDCSTGDVRLVTTTGSVSSDAGRAEYCYNGMWTPFCNMDTKVGSVICRQNGHTAYSCKIDIIKNCIA